MAGFGAGGAAGGGGPLAGLAAAVAGNGLLAIAAGLIVGIAGSGTLLATGAVHVGGGTAAQAAPAAGLQLVACPDVGPVIGSIPKGEKVLVTGRSADGGWLQVFYPGPAFDRAWTRAGPLRLEGDASGLPVASCVAPPTPTPRPTPQATTAVIASPAASPSVEPSPSAAASRAPSPKPSPSPSPSPSPRPSPTPPPTPTPIPSPSPTPNAAPKIAGLTASTAALSYDQGSYCPTAPKAVTFTLKASDAGGVTTATLYWRGPGASTYAAAPMKLAGGSAQNGTWTATLDTTANGMTTAGNLAYYAIVLDAGKAKTRSPAAGTQTIPVSICVNTGPTFTNGPSAGDSTIYADPLNAGCGSPIGTEIRATITDIDGVKSATLVIADQSGTITQRPMQGSAGDLWTSFINANDDGTQSGGSFTWQVVAVDGKGAQTTTDPQSLRVVRCDTPATFDFGGATTPVYNDPACTPNSVAIPVYATDRDNADRDSSRLQVVVTWSATNLRSGAAFSGDATAVFQKGNSFLASFPVTPDWQATLYSLTYTATSTDIYGGTSRSFTGKAQISVVACVILR